MDFIARFALILAGFICAAFAEVLAFLMAGAGHGWLAPSFYSMFLFLIYPLVFLRSAGVSRQWLKVDFVLIAVAVLADAFLIGGTYFHEAQYFMMVLDFVYVVPFWIAIWGAWQLITARRLWRAFDGHESGFG